MKYIIIDEQGRDCGGSICREWNSLQDYYRSVERGSSYYAGDIRAILMFVEEEIKKDAQNRATIQGRTAQKLNRDENKSIATMEMFQEVGEEDYWPMSKRIIRVAINEIESCIYSIAKHQISGMRNDANYEDGKAEYVIELRVPDSFSDTSINSILNNSHEYIVARVLWEWANLTHVPFAEFWLAKMEMCKAELSKEAKRGAMEDGKLLEGWV